MANAAVTPPMRVHGWNIHFLAGPDEFHFAGLFKAPNSDLITFQDVVDELRLCFNIPKAEPDRDPWDTIAFKLAKTPPGTTSDLPSLVAGDDLSLPVPGLPARSPKIQPVVKYHVISHRPCNIASGKPLKDHLSGSCYFLCQSLTSLCLTLLTGCFSSKMRAAYLSTKSSPRREVFASQ
jgi:hypothetical protein